MSFLESSPLLLGQLLPTWADLGPLGPALILVLGGAALLLFEVATRSGQRGYMPWFTAVVAVIAALWAVRWGGTPVAVFGGAAVADGFSAFIAVIAASALSVAVLASSTYLRSWGLERGEFYALLCFATAGMILLAMAADLLVMFVSLEVMSVSTYALVAFRRDREQSAEAAFKYLILGALSSALFLYGAALLYTATGTIRLAELAQMAAAPSGLFLAGAALATVGFAFKVAAVPFHMWTPDVYEGAPTPVTAFMAAGVKAAAFAALIRLLVVGLGDASLATSAFGWGQLVYGLSLLSMIVGNFLAVVQDNVKRMLAYSSIAHAGYALLGVTAAAWGGPQVTDSVLFYLLAYAVTAVGAFAVVSAVERRLEGAPVPTGHIDELAGLSRRAPGLAFAMGIFMFSLAGIPPTIGFIGKLEVLRALFAAAQANAGIAPALYVLAAAGMLTSVAGVYYYLRVVVWMYMRPAPESAPAQARSGALRFGVTVAAVAVILLGILPGAVSGWAQGAVRRAFGGRGIPVATARADVPDVRR